MHDARMVVVVGSVIYCQIFLQIWLCMVQQRPLSLGENGSPPDAGRALEWSLTVIAPRILHLKKADTTTGMDLYLGTQ